MFGGCSKMARRGEHYRACCRWRSNVKLGHVLFSAVFFPSIRRESCSFTVKALTWSDNEKQSWHQRARAALSQAVFTTALLGLSSTSTRVETLRARLRQEEHWRWDCDFLLSVKTWPTGWKMSCSEALSYFQGVKASLQESPCVFYGLNL